MVSLDSNQPVMTRTSKDNIFNTEGINVNYATKDQVDELKDLETTALSEKKSWVQLKSQQMSPPIA